MLIAFVAVLTFHSEGMSQNDPILFVNKTDCEITAKAYCGDCPGANDEGTPTTINAHDTHLFDGDCTGDFAYVKFSVDGAIVSWYVSFAGNAGDCGQDGDCIGVAGSVAAGTIFNNQSTCTTTDLKYAALHQPGSLAGSECQVVVFED